MSDFLLLLTKSTVLQNIRMYMKMGINLHCNTILKNKNLVSVLSIFGTWTKPLRPVRC